MNRLLLISFSFSLLCCQPSSSDNNLAAEQIPPTIPASTIAPNPQDSIVALALIDEARLELWQIQEQTYHQITQFSFQCPPNLPNGQFALAISSKDSYQYQSLPPQRPLPLQLTIGTRFERYPAIQIDSTHFKWFRSHLPKTILVSSTDWRKLPANQISSPSTTNLAGLTYYLQSRLQDFQE